MKWLQWTALALLVVIKTDFPCFAQLASEQSQPSVLLTIHGELPNPSSPISMRLVPPMTDSTADAQPTKKKFAIANLPTPSDPTMRVVNNTSGVLNLGLSVLQWVWYVRNFNIKF